MLWSWWEETGQRLTNCALNIVVAAQELFLRALESVLRIPTASKGYKIQVSDGPTLSALTCFLRFVLTKFVAVGRPFL